MASKKYDQLQKLFPGKKLPKLISRTKLCPLRCKEMLVYSKLVSVVRDRGASIRLLAQLTGLDRNKTLPKILLLLSSHGLAVKRGKRWFPGEPNDDQIAWFAIVEIGEQLETWFGYNRYLVPAAASPLSVLDCAVLVADSIEPGNSSSLLAARFGVTRRTISRCRNKIAKLGPPLMSWFEDRPQKTNTIVAPAVPSKKAERPKSNSKTPTQNVSDNQQESIAILVDHLIATLKVPEYFRAGLKLAVAKMVSYEIERREMFSILTHLKRKSGSDEDLFFGLLSDFAGDGIDRLMSEHMSNCASAGRDFGNGVKWIHGWIESIGTKRQFSGSEDDITD